MVALGPTVAHAQGDDDSFILRVNGDVEVATGETVGTVIVVDGNVTVDGTISDSLVVIDGTAAVNGRVEGDITVISGDLDLRSGSTVNNVHLIRSDLLQADGATITGDVNERENVFFRGAWAVFSILAWFAFTIAVVVAGLVFAAVGGRQLRTASLSLTEEPGNSILASVILWVAVPLAAGLIIATLVGIPLGIGVLLFLLPAMWFLGYIAAGTRLGMMIAGRDAEHPYAAAAAGLLILQLLLIIPVLGALVVGVAGLWGAGAVALVAWRAARGTPAAPAQPEVSQPVA
jgi:cytoskeletal protein CcmA (bactofilin family)